MGDKNALALQGFGHKVFSARNRMKFLLPCCLLVVGIVWSSSSLLLPFSSPAVAESRLYLRQCTSCATQADSNGAAAASSLHPKESQLSMHDQQSKASRAPRRTLVKQEETSTSAEAEAEDKPPQMEEMDILRTKLSAALMQSEKRAHAGDTRITGDLTTNGFRYALRVLDQVRAHSLPAPNSHTPPPTTSCKGRYIYVYDLPPEFNLDLTKRCDSLFPWFTLCEYFQNSGFGTPINKSSHILKPSKSWYNTHQYSLELVSHARTLSYKCRTHNPSQASLFYIPYYGGLDVIRWHWALNATNANRDALGHKLVHWLQQQPSWNNGRNHVLVLGKISWDFRRQLTGDWGSRLLEFPEMQTVTKLLIERNPWHKNDIGVPHPTFFHPSSASEMREWLTHVENQERPHLVSFVGKDRHLDPSNVRSALIGQCRNASSSCWFVECEQDKCLVPEFVTRVFLGSVYCMQPPGDSPTRRSVFDSLVAGCIPVLFHPCTAYLQYPWHLPRNASSWSVYVSEADVRSGKVNVVEVLKGISEVDRVAMRRVIVNEIVPGIVYAAPGAEMAPFRDAFDVVLDNLLYRAARNSEKLAKD